MRNALGSRKSNEAIFKKITQNIRSEEGEIWITKLEFDYAYSQIKLDEKTRNLCIFTVTGEFTGTTVSRKDSTDCPIYQQSFKNGWTKQFKHPAWLDDILIVTKGNIEEHETEVKKTMKKLKEAGYRLHPKKCEFFQKEAEWMGHKIDQNGIRPLQDKLEAITKINKQKNEKELKSFVGATHYLSNYIENLSAQSDRLRKLLKKKPKQVDMDRRIYESIQRFKEPDNTIIVLAH